jgi:hypothetical protein
MKKLIFLVGFSSASNFLFLHEAHAMSQKIPSSFWSCTFKGIEEVSIEDKQGILHLELREILYGTDWLPQKEEAYLAAKKECEMYSVRPCLLSGCSQKGELR